ncbi:MAG: DNA translocase FtsK 4TM domain-containing protein, partial [Gammaproteobacteria bacterium]
MSRSTTLPGAAARNSAFVLSERALRLVHEARWLALAVLALFLLLVLATYHPADPGWSHAAPVRTIHNAGGRVGAWIADLLLYLFGLNAYLIAGAMVVSVLRGMRRLRAAARQATRPGAGAGAGAGSRKTPEPDGLADDRFAWERWVGFALLLAGGVALESMRLYSLGGDLPFAPGGVLGALIGGTAQRALGFTGATLLLVLLFGLGF